MPTIIVPSGSTTVTGTSGDDVIYGFDPNDAAHRDASSISATRVATGLDQPLFAGAPTGDNQRLFIVGKTGRIEILDLHTGLILPTPFLDLTGKVATDGEEGLLGLAFDPGYASNGFIYVNLVNLS